MGAERQAQARLRERLRGGEGAGLPPPIPIGLGEMGRNGIVEQGAHALNPQAFAELIAARVADHKEVPDGVRPLRDLGQPEVRDPREGPQIATGEDPTPVVPGIEVSELDA